MQKILSKIKIYLQLIKGLQTTLLVITGVAGFLSIKIHDVFLYDFFALTGSLFLSISGTTVLNMIFDRDIDSKMRRTNRRPLPSGKIRIKHALVFGISITTLGIAWALSVNLLFGLIVFSGFFIDYIVYTILLKRRTAWAIVFGGISGGMPILAGRVTATSEIDIIGIVLALAVLFWIPTHILTFTIKYKEDYKRASVPTFPEKYGEKLTRLIIVFSGVISAIAIGYSVIKINLPLSHVYVLAVFSFGLFGLSVYSIFKPSEKLNFALFKYASFFMLLAMILIIIGN